MQDQQPKKRGFAAISPERMREIASAGGIARKRAYDLARGRGKVTQAAPAPGASQQDAGSSVLTQ